MLLLLILSHTTIFLLGCLKKENGHYKTSPQNSQVLLHWFGSGCGYFDIGSDDYGGEVSGGSAGATNLLRNVAAVAVVVVQGQPHWQDRKKVGCPLV